MTTRTRTPITQIIEDIKKLLEKQGPLSIRQISIKTKHQWRTINKAIETMKVLGILNEKKGDSGRDERVVGLK